MTVGEMSIKDNFLNIQEDIRNIAIQCGRDPKSITLVAVTKTYSLEHVLPAYEGGCRDFGENRVQEALDKIPQGPQDLRWHLIGTLQKNKVRKVIGRFALIHAVDNLKLAQKISSFSEEKGVTTPILLQANTSGEESKHGQTPDQWRRDFEKVIALPNIQVEGLMTMAPFTEDEGIVRSCFSRLRDFRDELGLRYLSMGMSHDYPIAIQEGATHVRVGSAIFGERSALH